MSGTRAVLLAVIGAGCGGAVLAEGYYDLAAWAAITVGVVGILLGLVIGAPGRPWGWAAVALGALVSLATWSWLSTGWAESDDQAVLMAGRWALYAALLAALLLLLRRRSDYLVLISFLAGGVLVVALWVVANLLGGDPASLFVGARLVEPLGYVNGQAGFFLVGLWLFIAVAEQTRYPPLAGLGLGAAFVLASLLLLSQSRAVMPAVAVSGLVLLLLVPGRARRLSALIAIGVGLFLISGPLLDVYRDTHGVARAPSDKGVLHQAGGLILLSAVVLGMVWGAAQALLRRVSGGEATTHRLVPRAEGALGIAVVVLAGGVALTAINDPLGRVRRQYDRFVNLRVDPRQDSRFFSGGGYRYDYWRVALDQFRDHPLEGVGAGNYDRTYFRERRTSEDIRQPHSIELQTLGELGLVGGTALAAFLVAVLAGLGRAARRARDDSLVRVIAVAGGGAFVAWLVHTSVDWLHLIPGVTGVALCAAAMLLGPSVRPVRSGLRVPRRTAATGAVAVAAVVVAVGVGRLGAAEAIRTDGREQLASDPIKALRLANESLDLDREALPTLYLKSAAYARLGLYQRARTPLIYATGLEPHNFLPWALLGDLAVRRAEFRRARRYYRRAHSMNPRDFRLERLAADPRLALAKS